MKTKDIWLLFFLALMGVWPIYGQGTTIPMHSTIYRDSLVSVTADPIDFGTRYIEYDPIATDLILQNMEYFPINISSLVFQDDESPFSTNASLPISIEPIDTCMVHLLFDPFQVGTYRDTLFIFCDADTIPSLAVSLKGRCEHIPPNAVDNLQLVITGNDANLTWDEVTTDMYGNPFDVEGYLVLYNETIGNDPEDYIFLWETGNLYYTHPDVILFSPRQFYQVVAYKLYDDERRTLLRSFSGQRMKKGDVEALLSDLKAVNSIGWED